MKNFNKKQLLIKINYILSNVFKYLTLPLLIGSLLISTFSICFSNKTLELISGWILLIVFIYWLAVLSYQIAIKKICNIKGIQWFLFAFIFIGIYSLFLYLFHLNQESKLYFIISGISFELFAVGYIFHKIVINPTHTFRIIMMSVGFIFMGYFTIYIGSYSYEGNIIFNSLTGLFSAIVGGSLTLGGVAWTIKNQKEQKENEEKEKAKPYFKIIHSVEKSAISGRIKIRNNKFGTSTYLPDGNYIKNSNLSLFTIKRVFSGNEQVDLNGSLTVLPNEIIALEFFIKDLTRDIVFELEDSLGIFHYYKTTVKNKTIENLAKIGVDEFNLLIKEK